VNAGRFTSPLSSSLLRTPSKMPSTPSRQERRKAERAAAKRAPGQAGAASAAGAATALGNVQVNAPLGDWTTQDEDHAALFERWGHQVVEYKVAEGDPRAGAYTRSLLSFSAQRRRFLWDRGRV